MASPKRLLLRSLGILTLCAASGCLDPASDTTGAVRPDDSGADSAEDRRLRRDSDRDGYARAPWGADCDDARASVHPGAAESCGTTYDDDCDGSTNDLDATGCTPFYADVDGDGYGDAANDVCACVTSGVHDTADASDCDDGSVSVNPGATEVYDDGVDQDCDGADATTGTGGGTGGGTDTGDAPLFGYWGLNGYLSASGLADVQGRMGMSVVQLACAAPSYCVNTMLPMIRAAGLHATFRMTPSPSYYTTSGNFDLAKWKDKLNDWEGYDVQAFVDDGTLVGHMILDDISNYSGLDATAADLDEMARYSKELFPGLMTFVRERATEMPVPSGGTYVYVDACVNQYSIRHGAIATYFDQQEAEAEALGLGVINGLNLADGGDGRSGQPGWRTDGTFYAMSAEEVLDYGTLGASVPSMGMFLNWEYDGEESWSDGTIGADYLDHPDIQAALLELSGLVGSHAPVTLLKP